MVLLSRLNEPLVFLTNPVQTRSTFVLLALQKSFPTSKQMLGFSNKLVNNLLILIYED